MADYKPPLDDFRFVLHQVLGVDALFARLPGAREVDAGLIDAVLEEAGRFAAQVLAPLNASGDAEGCHFDPASGRVSTPKGFADAYHAYVEGGWCGLNAPAEFGGQGLPETLGAAVKEMIDAANLAWGNYPLLSHGATEALRQHGEDWQRELFLRPIIDGRWTGTMCLTEAHCGSDLGLLRTRAQPADDGGYRISGDKIFITAGEHDLTENIVHLVLARLPDAPAGSRGISLFVVPKRKVGRDGQMGGENGVVCTAIEHKMGIHGSATCAMHFEGAEGWLVGQPHKGLAAMFTMMNTARLAVGIQGLGLIERGYQASLDYARERLQMRDIAGAKFPEQAADPLIVHADIRRMLLTQKAFGEGGRVLALHAATLVDIEHLGDDAAAAKAAEEELSFLIPIVKAVSTEAAIECTQHAVQIFGGHGYIKDNGVEQLARDARITTIYEGTTQIQALDLLGRKVLQLKGAGLKHFLARIEAFCRDHADTAELAEFVAPLGRAAQDWSDLTQALAAAAAKDPEVVAAAAVDYLFLSGHVALAWAWAISVAAADQAGDARRAAAKRATARFHYQRLLPRIESHRAAIHSGPANVLDLPAGQFD
ncbi:MAG TPA: acyl-CoA dehydrogenase C-terminal domain-containing protein [Rhodanobacteraceae bacterium]|nr:acyl-CoA dehydrogenase C-terminal domain-containing protein [Rhodanobacteraceae bacterium]